MKGSFKSTRGKGLERVLISTLAIADNKVLLFSTWEMRSQRYESFHFSKEGLFKYTDRSIPSHYQLLLLLTHRTGNSNSPPPKQPFVLILKSSPWSWRDK